MAATASGFDAIPGTTGPCLGILVVQRFGYARNTVAKAVANPIPPGFRLSKPRPKPAIEPVKQIIDAWMEQARLDRPKTTSHGSANL